MSTPRWELHIRPMFNLQDWDHMRSRFDFSDVNAVWASRHAILDRLRSDDPMPPRPEGGPWPREWVDLFDRWIVAGETEFGGQPPRLTIGQGTGYNLAAGFGKWRLTATVSVPSPDSKAWLHLVAFSPAVQTLTMFIEAPANPAGPASDRPLLAMINASPALQEVVVINANGETRLPRPGAGT
ncbi:hypothetical protein LHFGNBLO_006595 (plasmid) [Mesorhizobium sp. AR10]|uniref:hypothetical protein n=1 Tax=Mesorhizobium sp. AR10 TaxID=2865839 RepID=UPI00215DEE32|nr:hypothetical protein [Mesorhizobium sp. AR10]UVK35731.1 hypothetical protein LHFGNBLO_006595 [Mesorhizobium sp. AR10]